MIATLATIPWLLMVGALAFLVRRRPRLQDYPAAGSDGWTGRTASDPPTETEAEAGAVRAAESATESETGLPKVTVVLPTWNDADRVGACLATLLGSEYPSFEVVVVDHDSVDGTREVVQALAARAPQRLRLVRTRSVPEDRPWRAWACLRGCREAQGELLLFTEPGTVHDPELLGRAVAALRQENADLVTVPPRLRMHGFWERLVTPHVWLVVRARFPSARWINRSRSHRNAFAHHQFMLFRRDAYEAFGGHAAVGRGQVEDVALAQAAVAEGLRLHMVHGDAYIETRMVRGLGDIASRGVANLPLASRSTVFPWAAVFAPWLIAAVPFFLFVLPPVLLVLGLVLPGWETVTRWGIQATGLSLLFWLAIYTVHQIRPAYAFAYPLGALATVTIFVRSALRTGIAWRGSGR